MTSFTYFPAVSDVNVILSDGLFFQVVALIFSEVLTDKLDNGLLLIVVVTMVLINPLCRAM